MAIPIENRCLVSSLIMDLSNLSVDPVDPVDPVDLLGVAMIFYRGIGMFQPAIVRLEVSLQSLYGYPFFGNVKQLWNDV